MMSLGRRTIKRCLEPCYNSYRMLVMNSKDEREPSSHTIILL